MDKIKCITFDKAAQDALPAHIKAKMKADREKPDQRHIKSNALAGTVKTIVAMTTTVLVIEIVNT